MEPFIHTSIARVLALTDLAPRRAVNRAMSALVSYVTQGDENDRPRIPADTVSRIQRLSSEAEYLLEASWADRVIRSRNPRKTMRTFPYAENYRELVARELSLVTASGLTLDGAQSVLLVGSGPLPLSAFAIHEQSGAHVDGIDISEAATAQANALTHLIGDSTICRTGAGQAVTLTQRYDLIVIAALAGSTLQEKQAIIDNVAPHLTEQGRIVVRSARGMRELLYPAIEATALTGVALLQEHHPTDHIINSIFVYKRAA